MKEDPISEAMRRAGEEIAERIRDPEMPEFRRRRNDEAILERVAFDVSELTNPGLRRLMVTCLDILRARGGL